jgi:hypothetical protein
VEEAFMPTVNKIQGPVTPSTQNTATNAQASTTPSASEPTSQGYSSESSFESGNAEGPDPKKIVDDMYWQMMWDRMNAQYKAKMEEARRNWQEEG